jgi:hypothetical protein
LLGQIQLMCCSFEVHKQREKVRGGECIEARIQRGSYESELCLCVIRDVLILPILLKNVSLKRM